MLTITTRTGDYYGDGNRYHIWETHDADGELVAELYISTERNEIMNIEVGEDHRGEGHARALYEAASSQIPVFHAPVAHRTIEGNAFAEAVGGETVAPYPCDCDACNFTEE